MGYILSIDAGTQSLRACVIDQDLVVLEKEKVAYQPRVLPGNRVEMDAEDLWSSLLQACGRLTLKSGVKAVVFSTLCPSLLPMDGDGNPLHPIILHLDRRSYRQAVWALERIGEDTFLQVAGNLPIPGGISLTSLLWIKEHLPEIYARKDVCFGHAVTFFMKRLTGRFLIDPSNASFTGLYDTVGYGDWDHRLTEPLQIDRRKLPAVALSTAICGELTGWAAGALGLNARLPVVIGANDTTCAAVGAGVDKPGDIMNTSGTVEIMALCLDRPLVSKNHLLRTHAYPGKWLAMRTVGAGGASIEWFRDNFCKEMTKEEFYQSYLKEVLTAGRTPEGRFQPYLAGDRHRIKLRKGAFTGLTLNTTREDLLLALIHGIIAFQAKQLSAWQKDALLSKTIYHVGGGASEAYTVYKQQVIKGFQFVKLGETTIAGAAKLALDALA
jgi:xylulokinase